MNILDVCKIFHEIRKDKTKPTFVDWGICSQYKLDTRKYVLNADMSAMPYNSYTFTVINKQNKSKLFNNGILAKIMFLCMQHRAKQK